MFAHIEGRIEEKHAGELVIETSGVGFSLLCSNATVAAAPDIGAIMRCYTHFAVREDGMDLYGFATKEERDMFRRLNGVSGVGPRTALGILSTLSLRDLTLALITGDATAISRAPNIGKKTAHRLILELKDNIEQMDVSALSAAGGTVAPQSNTDAVKEAVQALMALGYSSLEANRAVATVRDEADTVDELILHALKGLGG